MEISVWEGQIHKLIKANQKKRGIRRLNYMYHQHEEEGRREQEAGSTWPPTHSPILHISN